MSENMNQELINLDDLGIPEEELFAPYDNSAVNSEKITAPRYSYWKSVFRVFFKRKINIILLVLLGLVILLAYVYPMIMPYDSAENITDLNSYHMTPGEAINYFGFNLKWIFGTNSAGGSTFNAVWSGARISISLALICAAINMVIGIVLGAIWGFSKRFDIFMIEVYNIIGNVPYILVISVLIMILTGSFWTLVFAMTLTGWIGIAYFIRTQVLIIRDREYNLASRCLGTSIFKITVKNLLPFMTSVIVTIVATEIPSYISYEVFLSYIGMGVSDMSLGRLIETNQPAMTTPGWGWEFWSPVIIAAIITVVLYVVGQNLGDATDPRTHM